VLLAQSQGMRGQNLPPGNAKGWALPHSPTLQWIAEGVICNFPRKESTRVRDQEWSRLMYT